MFRKLAAEALGLSDIGVIVSPSDYDKVDADDYLFHEDGEKIFFLIKSKKDEYCFTNLGLVHVDGESAVSAKRTIRRHDFATHPVSHVSIETAGTVDLDIELKFVIGDKSFSIDVKKNYLETLKDVYKALIEIGRLQRRDEAARTNALRCLEATTAMHRITAPQTDEMLVSHFNALLANLNATLLDRHATRDFSHVFEKYIHA